MLPGILGGGQQALGVYDARLGRNELSGSGEEAPCCDLGAILGEACVAQSGSGARMARKFLAECEGGDRQERWRRPALKAGEPDLADADGAARCQWDPGAERMNAAIGEGQSRLLGACGWRGREMVNSSIVGDASISRIICSAYSRATTGASAS